MLWIKSEITEVKIPGTSNYSAEQIKPALAWAASLHSSNCFSLNFSHFWTPGGMHVCIEHLCLFGCLFANICPPQGNEVDPLMPCFPIYLMWYDIKDIFPTVTSGSSYHLFTMCTLLWISSDGWLNSGPWPCSRGQCTRDFLYLYLCFSSLTCSPFYVSTYF